MGLRQPARVAERRWVECESAKTRMPPPSLWIAGNYTAVNLRSLLLHGDRKSVKFEVDSTIPLRRLLQGSQFVVAGHPPSSIQVTVCVMASASQAAPSANWSI